MARKRIPKQTEKLVYQQAGSRCSFCGFDEVAALDLHHITPLAEGGSDEPANLILACKNCHARAHSGAIPEVKVRRVKASQGAVIHRMPGAPFPQPPAPVISIGRDANGSIIAGRDIHVHGDAKTRGLTDYPPGSIGVDLLRKNYIAYLVNRYNTFRKAGQDSYGDKRRHSHAAISANIKSEFKVAGVYHVPAERFDELVGYLHGRIDKTIQAKRNRSRGHRAYSSFEDYTREQGGG